MIVPRGRSKFDLMVYPEALGYESINRLESRDTLYVVEPGMTKDSCNAATGFLPKTILVCLSDWRHWGESEIEKNRACISGLLMFFPLWKLDELLHSHTYFPFNLSVEEVEHQFHQFGECSCSHIL